MLVDAHAHLHVRDYDSDREEVIARAQAAGVAKIINVGFDATGNFKALALAKKYDFMWCSMGIHPHGVSEWSEDVGAKIEKAAQHEEKIIALGEMGLDYYKNFQPRDLQQKVLREQLRLAHKLGLPVIIHCRDAYADLFKILDEEKFKRILLHCFSGTSEEAEEGLQRGYFIGFTGIVTYPKAETLRGIAKKCPENKLMIETDCPYLAPQSTRGKRNEPAFIVEIAHHMAVLRGISMKRLEKILERNAKEFFGI